MRRKVYKSIEEVRERFPENAKIYEHESFFIVEIGKTVSILPKALNKERIYTTMLANGFPEKYLKVVFNGIEETEAVRRVKEMRKRGIILDGPAGVGKSIASTWKIAKMLQIREIYNPLYISCISFPDLKELYTKYRQHDAYLIDDIISTLPQARLDMIMEIIYHAELEEKLLFITSNSFMEVAKFFPEAILSRLRGYCEFYRIKEHKDLRLSQ
jgi:DNA replication protein DnaC